MKNLPILLSIAASLMLSVLTAQESNPLYNLTDRISEAQSQSFRSGTDQIAAIITSIESYEEAGSGHWKEYWLAYAKYQQSMVYAYGQQVDEDKAKAITKEAITILDDLNEKNVEHYALLGYMKGYSLQWVSFLKIPKESGKASKWVAKALELGPDNPRANMVFGNNDFYTPAMFGGGKKVEKHMLKAISLYKEQIANPYMPSWGMPEAYQMLTRHYLKKDQYELAMETIQEGIARFPNHVTLQKLETKVTEDYAVNR